MKPDKPFQFQCTLDSDLRSIAQAARTLDITAITSGDKSFSLTRSLTFEELQTLLAASPKQESAVRWHDRLDEMHRTAFHAFQPEHMRAWFVAAVEAHDYAPILVASDVYDSAGTIRAIADSFDQATHRRIRDACDWYISSYSISMNSHDPLLLQCLVTLIGYFGLRDHLPFVLGIIDDPQFANVHFGNQKAPLYAMRVLAGIATARDQDRLARHISNPELAAICYDALCELHPVAYRDNLFWSAFTAASLRPTTQEAFAVCSTYFTPEPGGVTRAVARLLKEGLMRMRRNRGIRLDILLAAISSCLPHVIVALTEPSSQKVFMSIRDERQSQSASTYVQLSKADLGRIVALLPPPRFSEAAFASVPTITGTVEDHM